MYTTFDELKLDMKTGFQSTGISYWEHGQLVAARYRDLISAEPRMDWVLPKWFSENKTWICEKLQPHYDALQTYQLWHDCGKPAALVVDADGKKHYPNHAAISAEIWRKLGGDELVAKLIEQDMLCHQLRPAGAIEFSHNPLALPLLITALCELHANAVMFGGFTSESFKIKYRRLTRCGELIMDQMRQS